MAKTITVDALIHAPIERVWECWTNPDHIVKWNFASDDWECPKVFNDVVSGGKFNWRMAAKDGSFAFDFEGVYSSVIKHERIEYGILDGRKVIIVFTSQGNSTKVVEIFEMENENSEEMQRGGWQAILNNFKKHAEKE